MDLGTHLFTGVVAASFWPGLDLRQKILVVLFAILPDSFEWLHQLARKHYDNDGHLVAEDYNRLSKKIKLGLKLWWPFYQKRIHGFFDWWLVKFFRGWELLGYWAILTIMSVILIRSFW